MRPDDSRRTLSPSVRAEAAAWVARLHSSGRTPAAERALRQWLRADPAHVSAFELATEAWEIGGSVPRGALPRLEDPFVEGSTRGFETRPFRKSPRARAWVAMVAFGAVLVGAFVYLNQERAVATAVGEQRMLTLKDGSRIFLNTDTRLVVDVDEDSRAVRLEGGEALFDVNKDPERPFVVTAGGRSVVAIGTSFVVRQDSQALSVTLVEGKVAVSPVGAEAPGVSGGGLASGGAAAGRSGSANSEGPQQSPAGETVLLPGQRVTFVAQQRPRLDEPSIEKVTAWRRGEVILDKTSLEDAASEMNRYSTVKLVIDDPVAGEIQVSGIFRAGDSARFARAVSETYGLSVHYGEGRIVISRAASSSP